MLIKKDRLEKKREQLKQEPGFRKNLYREKVFQHVKEALKQEISEEIPEFDDQPTLFPESMEGYVKEALKKIKAELKGTQQQLDLIQDEIDDARANIKQSENDIEKINALLNLQESTSESLAPEELEKIKNHMDQYRYSTCIADIVYSECEAFNVRYESLKIPKIMDVRDARVQNIKREQTKRKIAQFENRRTDLEEQKASFTLILPDLEKKRDTLYNDETEKKTLIKNLQEDWQDFVRWNNIIAERSPYPELTSTIENIFHLESDILSQENKLSDLLKKHNLNRELLSDIFSHCVKTVLAKDSYDGAFELNQKEISFQITHGPAMSGEAVETLSVLLADISCLIFNAVSKTSVLPGFLIHDSPREADLGLRIYLNFIRFLEKLHTIYGGEERCPFQYIITTTTAPPAELRDTNRVKLRLNAAAEDGLLLKKDIFLEPEPSEIFGN